MQRPTPALVGTTRSVPGFFTAPFDEQEKNDAKAQAVEPAAEAAPAGERSNERDGRDAVRRDTTQTNEAGRTDADRATAADNVTAEARDGTELATCDRAQVSENMPHMPPMHT